jgi:hypothetical protein
VKIVVQSRPARGPAESCTTIFTTPGNGLEGEMRAHGRPGTKHARNMAARPWSEARSAGPGQYAVDLQG